MKNYYRLAVKYFIETNNDDQLQITYKEVENYLEHLYQYEWYYYFDPEIIPTRLYKNLSKENKYLALLILLRNSIENTEILKLINNFKYRSCEAIFSSRNYNNDLFKFSMNKVLRSQEAEKLELEKQTEKIKHELRNLSNEVICPTPYKIKQQFKTDGFSLIFSVSIMLLSMLLIGFHIFIYSSNPYMFNHIDK